MENKKTVIVAFAMLFMSFLPGVCAKYQIQLLNTPTININGKETKAGDWFDDSAKISWQNDDQAMKVQTEDGKHIFTVTGKAYHKSQAKNFLDHVVTIQPMITRSFDPVKDRLEELSQNDNYVFDALYLDFSEISGLERLNLSAQIKGGNEEGNNLEFELQDSYFILPREALNQILEGNTGTYTLTIFKNGRKIMDNFQIEILPTSL